MRTRRRRALDLHLGTLDGTLETIIQRSAQALLGFSSLARALDDLARQQPTGAVRTLGFPRDDMPTSPLYGAQGEQLDIVI